MTVNVRIRDVANAGGLKEQIERKVGFATDRFAGRLIDVQVVVSDVNGPRGGPDKRCSIRGVLEGGRSVTVEDQGWNATTVVKRTVRRLGGSISRVLVRVRGHRPPVMKPVGLDARVA
jgi:putative sigma-54 modulation protein